jgi:hypothetical protein
MSSVGEQHLAMSCTAMFEAKGKPCRFDFSILIPIAIQILTELLSKMNCGREPSASELSSRLSNAKSDTFVGISVREAVRRTNKDQKLNMTGEEQSLTRQGLREGFQEMPELARVTLCSQACSKAFGHALT